MLAANEKGFRHTFHPPGGQAALQGTLLLREVHCVCRASGRSAEQCSPAAWWKQRRGPGSGRSCLAAPGPGLTRACMVDGHTWLHPSLLLCHRKEAIDIPWLLMMQNMPVTSESSPPSVFRSSLQEGPGKGDRRNIHYGFDPIKVIWTLPASKGSP